MFMFHLGQIVLEVLASLLIERLRSQFTRTKTPTNAECESIPKPSYLSGIVAYEDDQTVIFLINYAQINFPVSKSFLP
jgi:hypothetical protein